MKTLVVTAALITEGGRILLAQREAGDEWGLHWEFPGGTLEEDEGPRECIQRELQEELGIGVDVGRVHQAVFKRYENCTILLVAYQCRIRSGNPDCHRMSGNQVGGKGGAQRAPHATG